MKNKKVLLVAAIGAIFALLSQAIESLEWPLLVGSLIAVLYSGYMLSKIKTRG